MMKLIDFQEFQQVELRVGEVLRAEPLLNARKPAYVLHIDFGPSIGVKKSSAQITHQYDISELIGKQVVAVVNFPKKQIGSIMSECLVTGFYDTDGSVILAVPDKQVPKGSKLC